MLSRRLLGRVIGARLGHAVVEAALAAVVEVGALQPPVDKLVVEGELAHVRHKAEVPVPDVEHDEAEGLRVTVEEVLVPLPVVVVAHLQHVLLRQAAVQAAHPPQREILQHLPGERVPGAPDVQYHGGAAAKVHGLGGTEEGGGQGRAASSGGGQRLPRLRSQRSATGRGEEEKEEEEKEGRQRARAPLAGAAAGPGAPLRTAPVAVPGGREAGWEGRGRASPAPRGAPALASAPRASAQAREKFRVFYPEKA